MLSLGFRTKKKTSLGWQIFHQVVPFCQVAVFSLKHTQMLYVKVAPGKPQTGRAKIKITPDTGDEKIHWVGFHWVCRRVICKINSSFYIARFSFFTAHRKNIQFLYNERSYIVALGSLRVDGVDGNEDIRNCYV